MSYSFDFQWHPFFVRLDRMDKWCKENCSEYVGMASGDLLRIALNYEHAADIIKITDYWDGLTEQGEATLNDDEIVEQVLEVTVQKEEAGRAALQRMVAHLNKDGDYFQTVDGGIEGSELLWPIEAFMKRGFFVYAYRKYCLTVAIPSVTLFDQDTKDFFEAELRALALEYSGVDAATLDFVKAAPQGGV